MSDSLHSTLLVSAIQNGTVIDHLPAGTAVHIVTLLELSAHKNCVTLGLNLPSSRFGHKDLIKVEGREISRIEAETIAVLAPRATINIIREYELSEKFVVSLPNRITGFFTCQNTNCITRAERMLGTFDIFPFGTLIRLQCRYCERSFTEKEIPLSLSPTA